MLLEYEEPTGCFCFCSIIQSHLLHISCIFLSSFLHAVYLSASFSTCCLISFQSLSVCSVIARCVPSCPSLSPFPSPLPFCPLSLISFPPTSLLLRITIYSTPLLPFLRRLIRWLAFAWRCVMATEITLLSHSPLCSIHIFPFPLSSCSAALSLLLANLLFSLSVLSSSCAAPHFSQFVIFL